LSPFYIRPRSTTSPSSSSYTTYSTSDPSASSSPGCVSASR
jgi:hypothetical protein